MMYRTYDGTLIDADEPEPTAIECECGMVFEPDDAEMEWTPSDLYAICPRCGHKHSLGEYD